MRDFAAAQRRPSGGLTVADLWQRYSAEKAGRPVEQNMLHRGKSILPFFGHLRPEQITIEDCRNYVAQRRRAGRKDGTIWGQMNSLRTCLNWAVKSGHIDVAPRLELPPKGVPRERYLTREEIGRLIAAPSAPHIHLAIVLMLTTAARVTAVLELTWDRGDLDRRQINLRTSEGHRKGRAVVPINDTLLEKLKEARAGALTDYVVEWAGGPIRSIKKGFAAAVRSAGLIDCTPHVLRHTAAVHMAEAGVPMAEISQYLGHSDVQITASVYARFSPGHLRKAASALEFRATKVQ
ncbi:tyrosine-type recombinase/integrase [Vannielia litorea]|uniref:tyrosine-type recombinase/integrase n=1 Tax=Vannielia litorea TaxID=1217970 RepID=UPI0031401B69